MSVESLSNWQAFTGTVPTVDDTSGASSLEGSSTIDGFMNMVGGHIDTGISHTAGSLDLNASQGLQN